MRANERADERADECGDMLGTLRLSHLKAVSLWLDLTSHALVVHRIVAVLHSRSHSILTSPSSLTATAGWCRALLTSLTLLARVCVY